MDASLGSTGMNCMQYCRSLLSSPTMSKLLRQKDVLFNRFYAFWMQKYHPTRVITLTYQPFILTTTAIFTYHEAKVNTRMRNLAGYILFFLSSFAATIVSITDCTRMFLFEQLNCCTISHMFTNLFSYVTAECCNFRKRWNGTLYWHMYHCRCFWGCWWSCSRWDDGWSLSDVPRVHPGTFRKNFVSLGRFKKHSLNLDLQCSLLVNLFYYFQSFFAGLAASGAITSALRLVTKAAFENSRDGLSKGASMLETTMDKYTFAPVDLYLIYLLAWKFMQCSSPQYRASLCCCVFCYMLSSSLSFQLWSTIVQKQLRRDLWWSLPILLLVKSKIAQIQRYCINWQQVLYGCYLIHWN